MNNKVLVVVLSDYYDGCGQWDFGIILTSPNLPYPTYYPRVFCKVVVGVNQLQSDRVTLSSVCRVMVKQTDQSYKFRFISNLLRL